MRHDQGGREGNQQQGAPVAVAQAPFEGADLGALVLEPGFQTAGPSKDAEQQDEGDQAQCHQLDQRLEGHGHHQAFVTLHALAATGAEERREYGDQQGKDTGAEPGAGPRREGFNGAGHCLHLQTEQREDGNAGAEGNEGARPLGAVTEGEQVRQGAELVAARQFEDRVKQYRGQQEGAAQTQVIGQVPVTKAVGHADGPEYGPGPRVDAEAQDVDQRVVGPAPGQPVAVSGMGNGEQHGQIEGTDQQEQGNTKAHRRPSGNRARTRGRSGQARCRMAGTRHCRARPTSP